MNPMEFPRITAPVFRLANGFACPELRGVICESEFSIVANGEPLVKLLCSAAALRELAYGFLYSEGVAGSLADILAFKLDKDAMTASFTLIGPVEKPSCPTVSSGFGGKVLRSPLAGAGRLGMGGISAAAVKARVDLAATALGMSEAVQVMAANAPEYARTRGLHCSALFCGGEMLGCFEDIGRHNTFDKLAGHCLLTGASAQGALLTTTGRVSAEMCTKALRLGVAAIASCSGPTDQAVRLAREAGVMLVGYAGKPGRATVYA